MEGGWGVLLNISDSPFSDGLRVGSVSFGFQVASMVDVRAVRYCT